MNIIFSDTIEWETQDLYLKEKLLDVYIKKGKVS